MPGRAALTDIAGVKSDIKSIQMNETPSGAGDLVGEYSAIAGEARKGSDAYGMLSDPGWTRIDADLVGKEEPGMATKGEQHQGYGVGRTFHAGEGRKRKED